MLKFPAIKPLAKPLILALKRRPEVDSFTSAGASNLGPPAPGRHRHCNEWFSIVRASNKEATQALVKDFAPFSLNIAPVRTQFGVSISAQMDLPCPGWGLLWHWQNTPYTRIALSLSLTILADSWILSDTKHVLMNYSEKSSRRTTKII